MIVLEVLCHPRPGSLNHAIAARARQVLERLGHEVRFHDLYAERFDPVLTEEELARRFSFDEQVQLHARELAGSDGLLVVHPDWWGGPPAMLKGWIDRVFRPGIAYEFEGGEFERKARIPLLRGKRALVVCTSDASEGEGLRSLEALWATRILGYCGMEPGFLCLPEVFDSGPAERLEFMRLIEQAVSTAFPKMPSLAPARGL